MYNFDEIIDRNGTNSQNVEGWRPYIFKCGPEKVFPYKDDEFVRMWVADMEFSICPEILDAIKERVDRKILGYTMVYDKEYYKAFHDWCEDKYGYSFKDEDIIFSQGVIPALYQVVEDVVKPYNGKVLTLTPAYGFFLHACEYNGVELVTSPLKMGDDHQEIDFDDLEKKAKDKDVKLLMLCNPHNPSGRIWTEEELKKIAKIVEDNDLWIMSDEIHCDLIRKGLKHIPMGKIMPDYNKLITSMSASKTFNLAGLMFSEIIIRDKEEWNRFKSREKTLGSQNPLSIAAHKAAYTKGKVWLDELREYIDGNLAYVKEFLDKNLPETNFYIPEATYFAWVNMGKALPDIEDLPLFFANNSGVLLEGGDGLFVGNAKGYIRLNLAMPRSVLETGLQRMYDAIVKYRNK